MTGSLPTETGFEYVDTEISASNDIVPLNNVQKQVYKRIYHNIPYLLKTKGTIAGIRALITAYGVPDTILRISEFGGKDRNEAQDYDLKQDVFNYAFDTGPSATNYVSSSFSPNVTWSLDDGFFNSPGTVQFRFKSAPIPTASSNVASSDIRYSQSLWSTDDGGNIMLEYTGSGFVSGSYSGSIVNPYDYYGTLKFVPAKDDNPNISASIFLPFFNGDWWSVQAYVDTLSTNAGLFAANEINGKIGFSGSDTANGSDTSFYRDASKAFLNKNSNVVVGSKTYTPFSGSFQELRYWTFPLSESKFFDYTVNPYSNEGNTINSTPNELMFRAALGTQLDTGSRTSIHPRITGSAIQITQSWNGDISTFFTSSAKWVTNVEDIFQDQVPAGIKNRITNKIHAENLILAEAPYGYTSPTSSVATIASSTSDVISPMESIQQHSFVSQSYTPNVNYLEVAFSPSNQINDDINAQLGYFNLGDYIGDPRFISSSAYSYPDLDRLRNEYFEKYIKGYDIVDFVRLIKFFDNSLFKMIKDFTPARTSLASGVVVKQHLLERNRQRTALASSSFHDYSGSVKPFPKNYSTGSSDQPQYATSGSALYKFTGGPGGSFNKYNGLLSYFSGSNLADNPWFDNRFNLTQSWSESFGNSVLNTTYFNQSSSQYISGSYLGPRFTIHDDQSEFYTGEFSGSDVIVTTQSLNPGCTPYLNISDTPILFKPIFFSDTVSSVITRGSFNDQNNYPPTGVAWILSTQTNDGGSGNQQVISIKLNQSDVNGVEVIEYLDDDSSLRFLFSDAFLPYGSTATEYIVTGRTVYANFVQLEIYIGSELNGNNYYQIVDGQEYYPITSSKDGGSANWSLQLQTSQIQPSRNSNGNIINSFLVTTESSDLVQQNVFLNTTTTYQEQIIYDWVSDGWDTAEPVINDALGFFNAGGLFASTVIPNGSQYFTSSAYTIDYTPNIPYFITASIKYSASFDPNAGTSVTSSGIYHESSSYQGSDLTDQNFIFNSSGAGSTSKKLYLRTNGDNDGYANSLAAQSAAASDPPTPGDNDREIFTNDAGLFLANGQPLFDDANATSVTTLTETPLLSPTEHWFVAADGDGDLAVFTVSTSVGGDKVVQNYTQLDTSKLAWVTTANVGEAKFRPSPSSIGLTNQTIFRTSYDTQIPGNSGSNANVDGGHPKILSAGTASFQFSASRLTLAGTPPTLLGQTINYTNLTGSIPSLTGPDNDDFTATFANQFSTFADFSQSANNQDGNNKAGEVAWDYENLSNAAELNLADQGSSGYDNMIRNIFQNPSYRVVAYTGRNSNTVDTSANFTASIWYKNNTDQTGALTALAQWSGTEILSNNGIAELSSTNAASLISTPYNVSTPVGKFIFQLRLKSPNDFDYAITDFNMRARPEMSQNSSAQSEYPLVNFSLTQTNTYNQGSGTNTQQFTSSITPSGDRYNQAQVDIYLRVTGSNAGEGTYDRVITSSVYDDGTNFATSTGSTAQGYSGSIYPGIEIPFTFDPIDVFHPNPSAANTTVNYIHDMYYVEYSMSNFRPGVIQGVTQTQMNVEFQNNSDESIVRIGQRTSQVGGAEFNATGSLRLRKTNIYNPTSQTEPLDASDGGTLVANLNFLPVNGGGIRTAEVSGSYNGFFNAGDVFRLGSSLSKANVGSGLVITSLTASILPSQSIWSPITPPSSYDNFKAPTNTGVIISTYFGADILPFALALDCQPLLNNYNAQRANSYLMNVDYDNASGPIVPVNFEQILAGTATRAAVPDSNYTQLQTINPRYNGSKTTSKQINVWNIGDSDTYGKNPTVELRDAFFGYFNDLSDPYPNINGVTQVNLNYLIDEQGNALPPSLNKLSIATYESVFPKGTNASLAVKSGKSQYKDLGNSREIKNLMRYVAPIMYTQNSSNNYSPYIPLSGSGYISRFDNDDEADKVFASFMAAGPADSVNTNSPVQTVDYKLDPRDFTGAIPDRAQADPYIPYTSSTGKVSYLNRNFGEDTEQVVSLQTSIVTSYVSETKKVRDELKLELHCYSGSTDFTEERSFNLEKIDAKVYTETGQVYLFENVDQYGWFTYENITVKGNRRKLESYDFTRDRWRWSRVKVPTGGIKFFVDWEMYDTLFDRGVLRNTKPKQSLPITGIEWIFSINTGNLPIKRNDNIHFRIKGEFKDARSGYQQGYFFPDTYDGAKTSVKIQGQGVYDHLLATDNTGSAPFWRLTGSAGNPASFNRVEDASILVMSSSNLNEAYGTGFYQGYIPYYPGPSQYFPGGVEPIGTDFDEIKYPLEIKEGDEIRFGNNENFTYTIKEVFAPQENIEGDGKPRLKIRLDGEIPFSGSSTNFQNAAVNLDFFLIRRPLVTPNTLYLDQPFPYAALASQSISTGVVDINATSSFALTGSRSLFGIKSKGAGDDTFTGSFSSLETESTPGILYPDFPTTYLVESASIIVNDLVSKGIIES
jgi:hypothetical protein